MKWPLEYTYVIKEKYFMHNGVDTVLVALGGLTALAKVIVGPFSSLGTGYYFWVLGNVSKDEVNLKKN